MSNSALISKIESAFAIVRSQRGAPQLLADVMRNNGRALENMPYQLTKEMESLVMDLEIASWHDVDQLLPGVPSILSQVQIWLGKLPRDDA